MITEISIILGLLIFSVVQIVLMSMDHLTSEKLKKIETLIHHKEYEEAASLIKNLRPPFAKEKKETYYYYSILANYYSKNYDAIELLYFKALNGRFFKKKQVLSKVHQIVGQIYIKKKLFSEAIKHLNMVLVHQKNLPQVYIDISSLYQELNKNQQAQEALDNGLYHNPLSLEIHQETIKLLLKEKKYSALENFSQEALKVAPLNDFFNYSYAVALVYQEKNLKQAQSILEEIETDDEHLKFQILSARIKIYMSLKNKAKVDSLMNEYFYIIKSKDAKLMEENFALLYLIVLFYEKERDLKKVFTACSQIYESNKDYKDIAIKYKFYDFIVHYEALLMLLSSDDASFEQYVSKMLSDMGYKVLDVSLDLPTKTTFIVADSSFPNQMKHKKQITMLLTPNTINESFVLSIYNTFKEKQESDKLIIMSLSSVTPNALEYMESKSIQFIPKESAVLIIEKSMNQAQEKQ